MKRSALALTLLLPAVCAATAAAQFSAVRLSVPISPIAGLPTLLPSPMTGPLAGIGRSLPALTPSLVPTPAFAFLSGPQAALPAYQPLSLPGRGGQISSERSRDDVANPLRRVMPGVVIRFAGAERPTAPQSASEGPDAAKQRLDEEFDDAAPANPVVEVPRRKPVSSGRRIGLPEDDFRDLGF